MMMARMATIESPAASLVAASKTRTANTCRRESMTSQPRSSRRGVNISIARNEGTRVAEEGKDENAQVHADEVGRHRRVIRIPRHRHGQDLARYTERSAKMPLVIRAGGSHLVYTSRRRGLPRHPAKEASQRDDENSGRLTRQPGRAAVRKGVRRY